MKQYGKFFRKAALTAAVCLGLSQSVWAMPTGGTPVAGQVIVNGKNFAHGTFMDGATVVALRDSIINWNAFGIEAGKSLNFDTTQGALLNRVTGGNVSELYGTLNHIGGHPLFLVNPSGILVGDGAIINASNLVLSTLAISNEDFMNASANHYNDGYYPFETPQGKSAAAPVQIKGANINAAGQPGAEGYIGGFSVISGTVEVADGVTFTVDHAVINLAAGQQISLPYNNGSGVSVLAANADNKVSFVDSKVIGSKDHSGKFLARGGRVEMEGSAVNLRSGSAVNDVGLSARSSVALKNTDISIDGGLFIKGGKVDIQQSNLRSGHSEPSEPYVVSMEIIAAESRDGSSYTMTPSNTISADGLTVSEAQTVHIVGGNVTLKDSSIYAKNSYTKDDVIIRAIPSYTGSSAINEIQPSDSSAAYTVNLKNTKVTLDTTGDSDPSLSIAGGNVALDKSVVTLTGGNDNGLNIYAVSGKTNGAMTATSNNAIELSNGSELNSQGERLELAGGKISVADTSTISATGKTFMVANENIGFRHEEGMSQYTTTPYGLDESTKGDIAVSSTATLPTQGLTVDGNRKEVEPTPTPEPAPTPSIPEDVQEAYSEGMSKMQAAISGAADQGTRESATRSLVASVNQGTGSDRAKAAAISGMMVAILQDSSLTDSQKISLQVEVVNNFTPTKNAKAEADNTVTHATQETNNAATNQPAAEVAQPSSASEESPIKGL